MHPFAHVSTQFRRVTALALTLLAGLVPATAEPFRIVVIPDSQWASQKWPDLTKKMTTWIVANRDQQHIRYVLHVGDSVQEGGSEAEWQNIDGAMSQLDGKVPYIVAVGNHDYDRLKPPKSTVMFNRTFPVERFKKMPGFGGNFPEGHNDNSFHTFDAGGKKWLILCLNFMPSNAEIAWGNTVVDTHPDHQVILLTHSYLTHTERDVAGKILWEQLVRRHPNVSMVFCGHLSTVHSRAEGDMGNTVCEMLFDWQNDVDPEPNGYFAIVTIDPAAGTITSRSYSPALDKALTGGRSGEVEFKDVRFLPGAPAAVPPAQRSPAAAAPAAEPATPTAAPPPTAATRLKSLQEKLGEGFLYEVDDSLKLIFATSTDRKTLDEVKLRLTSQARALQGDLFSTGLKDYVTVVLPREWKGSAQGFYHPEDRSITAKSSGMQLVHEFTHALHWDDMQAHGQFHQNWVIEGLATLFENSELSAGHAVPQPDYRFKIIRRLVEGKHHVAWSTFVTWNQKQFMKAPGNHYSQAQSMMYYLHATGNLKKWYDIYVAGFAQDASGSAALEQVFAKSLPEIEKDWTEWLLKQPIPEDPPRPTPPTTSEPASAKPLSNMP